jgi:hypothetical protein
MNKYRVFAFSNGYAQEVTVESYGIIAAVQSAGSFGIMSQNVIKVELIGGDTLGQ